MMGEQYALTLIEPPVSKIVKYTHKVNIFRDVESFVTYTQDLLRYTEVPHHEPETLCVRKTKPSTPKPKFAQDLLRFTEVPY